MNLLKTVGYVLCCIILATGCSVSPSEYTAYFTNPDNGLRKEITTKGSKLIFQYISSELKALSEKNSDERKALNARAKELDKYVLFELTIDGNNPQINGYVKSMLEYDISLQTNSKKLRPVFYHVEHNPLQSSKKVQVYFLKSDTDTDYQLTIAKSQWLDEVQLVIEQDNILKSPHINL